MSTNPVGIYSASDKSLTAWSAFNYNFYKVTGNKTAWL